MKVAIIGGGASGLFCASLLAQDGFELTLFEKNQVLGRKLSTTGNGRGNLANENTKLENFSTNSPNQFKNWFEKLDETTLFKALETLGIVLTKDIRGRYYPFSFEAKAVSAVFSEGLYYKGIRVRLNTEVKKVEKTKTGFKLVYGEGESGFFDVVILATGGLAAPQLGASDFGLKVLKGFGHHIYPTYPAIVHLKSECVHLKKLDGLKWRTRLSFKGAEKDYLDEVHFAKDALSGPCAFQASIHYQKLENKPKEVSLDFLPDMEIASLMGHFLERKSTFFSSSSTFLFTGLLPEKLGQVLLKEKALLDKKLKHVTEPELLALSEITKDFIIPLSGTREYKFAQSTLGGASIDEFDSEKMHSRHVENLYATGEVLDVCGDCGGYNLYFAWLSGLLVARAIIEKSKTRGE